METNGDRLIAIGETARMLGVTVETIRRYDKQGKLHSIRPFPGAARKFKVAEILTLQQGIQNG